MTLNEAAYRVRRFYRTHYKETDELDIRYVYSWVITTRAKLLKQRLDKPMASIDNNLVQDLGPVELELVDSSICRDLPTPLLASKTIVRTKLDIPPTLDRSGHTGTFTRIGPADSLTTNFKVLDYDDVFYYGNGKFNRTDVCAFPLGNRIYLYSKGQNHFNIKYIDVRGVFLDPRDASLFKDSTWTEDSLENFPMNETLIDDMENIIRNEKILFNIPKDTSSNSANDIAPTTAPKK
jgi:hypothetical protein